ncbi:uncharacterized protein Naga_102334g1 [Nannochloropsis gaditana]|uniref:Nucleoporin seh1 n=1 Tax=Nannochloropsis gaditana TaxID=72520 RepID=W7THK0_9STRA|nr:uncharacterized protein Naga_102334g1 [Nannochloropsis gaditana]
MGRSYHSIACAGRDNRLRVFTLRRAGEEAGGRGGDWGFDPSRDAEEVEVGVEVWRVAWNALGTVLASTGEDGAVRLWQKGQGGRWTLGRAMARPVRGQGDETVWMERP